MAQIILLDDMRWADRPDEDVTLYDTCIVYANPAELIELLEVELTEDEEIAFDLLDHCNHLEN